jgi:hypothetical protein
MKHRERFLALCVALGYVAVGRPDIAVVREGESAATIVVGGSASDQVQAAADTLSEVVFEASGARLPIVRDDALPEDRPTTLIHVGPNRFPVTRNLLPGPDGTDVPQQRTITVPEGRFQDQPVFFSRLLSGLQGSVQTRWARLNRMRGRVSFHHNLLRLFPPSRYAVKRGRGSFQRKRCIKKRAA